MAKYVICLLFLLSCIPLVLITSIFFVVYHKTQTERSEDIQREIAQRIAGIISDSVDRYISDAKMYAEMMKGAGFDSDKLRALALYITGMNTEYDVISVKSEDYNKFVGQDAFRDASSGRAHISEIQLSGSSNLPYIYITVPLESARGTPAGVLELGVNVSKLRQLITKHPIGKNRYAYIVDRDGFLIIRQDVSSELKKTDCKTIEAVARFVENKPGVSRYRGLAGESVIGAAVAIPLMRWGVIVEEPLSSAMMEMYILAAAFAIISLLTIIAAVYSGWRFSYKRFVRPLKYFEKEAGLIAGGDLGRKIKITSDDEIGQLAVTFNRMTETIFNSEKAIFQYTNDLETLVKARTDDLNERNHRVTALLNNSGEGFLSFGRDMIVEPEFSRECRSFFGENIAGKDIASLLCENDEPIASFFRRTFSLILNTDDDFKKEMLMGVLPGELKLRGLNVRIKYRAMKNAGKTMLVLTDITKEKRLEEKIAEERLRLRLVVTSILNRDDVIDICTSFRSFLKKYSEACSGDGRAVARVINELYRQIHTFKGLFSQFDFLHLPHALHSHETLLSKIRTNGSPSLEPVRAAIAESGLLDHLEKDQAIVKEILGDSFFTPGSEFTIDEKRLRTFEEEVVTACRAGGNDRLADQILALISSLRKVNLKKMLRLYPGHTLALAKKLGKEVKPFLVTGDDVLVNPEIFVAFTESLVAVFRNTVAHGIETVNEREKAGKAPAGTVNCSVSEIDGSIIIKISDDGRGIDPAVVHRAALACELRNEVQLEGLTTRQKLLLVFEDGLSALGGVDEISGRGFGLAAVKKELENLHGTASIESELGRGVSIICTIPCGGG